MTILSLLVFLFPYFATPSATQGVNKCRCQDIGHKSW